ncbi:MAG: helix-turn-helix domain-containing protein [Acetatifactor sp.]
MRYVQYTEFGREVKKLLIDRGMTQAELAKEIGTSKQYLSMVLVGTKKNSKYVDKIKEVLGMSA